MYFNSEEEFFARKSAKQNRLKELEKEMEICKEVGRTTYNYNKNKITTKIAFSKNGESIYTDYVRKEMKEITSLLKREEKLYKKHLANRNLRNNPENLKCMFQYVVVSIFPRFIKTSELN